MMAADEAKVLWDREKKHWNVEIHVGQEVIRRQLPKEYRQATVDTLQTLAAQTARDEGYELDVSHVIVVQ